MPAQPKKRLTDEEIEQLSQSSLTDDQIDALQANYKPVDDRSDDERMAGYAQQVIGSIAPEWSDEILGGVMSALPGRGTYKQERDQARKIRDRYRQFESDWSPGNVAATTTGLVGGLYPVTKLFQGGQIAARALTGGQAVTRLGRLAQGAAGLALPGAVYSELAQAGQNEEHGDDALKAMEAGGLLIPTVGAVVGAGTGVLGAGGARIAQRVAQHARSAESKAARYIAEKFLDAGEHPQVAQKAIAEAERLNKPAVLADIAPQPVRDAGAAVARMPGPARQIAKPLLQERQEGQVSRISDDVAEAIGGDKTSFNKSAEEIIKVRSEQAAPLYDRAFHPKPLASPKIVEITNRPSGKVALQQGLKIAQNEGIALDDLVQRDAMGNVKGYTTKALHYMKLGLDDMIESARRSGDNSSARALTLMKKELLGEIDRLNPSYAAARQAFAGHSANKSAMEEGHSAWLKHPDVIRQEVSNLTPGEREFYRRGMAQRLLEEVEKSPDRANAVARIFGNSAKRERIRAALGDAEFNKLSERLTLESKMSETYQNVSAGSQTAERMASQSDIDDFVVGTSPEVGQAVVQSFSVGSILPLIHRIGQNGIVRLVNGVGRRTRGEIARLLFSRDPQEVRTGLARIAKEYNAAKKFAETQENLAAGAAANKDARNATQQGAGMAYEYGAAPAASEMPY